MIRAGTFREDLYLPAQRDRAARCRRWPSAPTTSCRWPSTSSRAGKTLRRAARRPRCWRHAWPGNVRELKNVMQRASLLAAGAAIRAGRPRPAGAARAARRRRAPSSTATRSSRRWRAPRGVVAQAAAELGLSRQALYRRMERLGISRSPPMRMTAARPLRLSLAARLSAAGGRPARWWRSSSRSCSTSLLPGTPAAGRAALCAGRAWCRSRSSRVRAQLRPMLSLFRALERHRHQLPRRRLFASACTGRATTSSAIWSTRTTRSATCCASSASALVQRELLLDTMVQNTPVAMLLVADARRRSSTPTSPRASCSNDGRKLEGHRLDDMLERAPPARCARRWSAAATACSPSARRRRRRGRDLPPRAPQLHA